MLIHAVCNAARFGSPTDPGYLYLDSNHVLLATVAQYGRFNLHFLPVNLYGWLLKPLIFFEGLDVPDPQGISLLITTPFLLLLLMPRRLAALEKVALANVALIALPGLLYYNSGALQFGQCFSLDWIALALIVGALAVKRVPVWVLAVFTGVGAAINVWGSLLFLEFIAMAK
jgi:hypothetical protein